MQTINCLTKLNDYHTAPRSGVTPTEYQLLEAIHKKEAGGKCVLNAVLGEDAVTWDLEPIAELKDEDGNVFRKGRQGKSHPRTNAEEIRRLKKLYHVKAKSGADGTHLLDDLYPGLNPELPQTFAEVGLTPAEKPVAAERASHPESVATIAGEPVVTPAAHPPLSAPLLHANELLAELEKLEAVPAEERTPEQKKRIKQLSILKPETVEA